VLGTLSSARSSPDWATTPVRLAVRLRSLWSACTFFRKAMASGCTLGALCVVSVLITSCDDKRQLPEEGTPTQVDSEFPRPTPWLLSEQPSPHSRTLRISILSTGCYAGPGRVVKVAPVREVRVLESPEVVELAAWLDPPDLRPEEHAAAECGDIGIHAQREIELSSPLGGRRLADPACRTHSYRVRFEICRDGETRWSR
jgi:hypothetical protein